MRCRTLDDFAVGMHGKRRVRLYRDAPGAKQGHAPTAEASIANTRSPTLLWRGWSQAGPTALRVLAERDGPEAAAHLPDARL